MRLYGEDYAYCWCSFGKCKLNCPDFLLDPSEKSFHRANSLSLWMNSTSMHLPMIWTSCQQLQNKTMMRHGMTQSSRHHQRQWDSSEGAPTLFCQRDLLDHQESSSWVGWCFPPSVPEDQQEQAQLLENQLCNWSNEKASLMDMGTIREPTTQEVFGHGIFTTSLTLYGIVWLSNGQFPSHLLWQFVHLLQVLSQIIQSSNACLSWRCHSNEPTQFPKEVIQLT